LEADIVILNIPIPFTSIFKFKNIPVVSIFHHYVPITKITELLTFPFYHFLERSQFSTNKRIIAISETSKKALMERYQLNGENIKVIPNGINLDRFSAQQYSRDIRMSYGDHIILFTGLMVPRKRVSLLLDAFALVLEDYPSASLLLLGEGPCLPFHKKEANDLGISNNTFFLGFIKDESLPSFYATSDIYVFPSELEGFGQVLLEAMASGTPVICTNISPMKEIIENGGLTFQLNNMKDLAAKIVLLFEDKEKYNKASKNALIQAKKYDWNHIAREYMKFLNCVLNRQEK
jgi:glycosyltransferase involved in cell wall biosynthesis